MSQPKKYMVRMAVDIAIEDLGGREVVATVGNSQAWRFCCSRDEIRRRISTEIAGDIDQGFAVLEEKLDLLERTGVKSPVEKLRQRGKR